MKHVKAFCDGEFLGVVFTCICGHVQRVQAPRSLFDLHTGPPSFVHSCVCTKEYAITLYSNVAQIDDKHYEYKQSSILAGVAG